ncbi:MAG: DUF2244 domain-containing protein [Rhodobacteraceae bacterium]|nr:DUF2244 domain-containing protein [Paracoccaceae bacterium]
MPLDRRENDRASAQAGALFASGAPPVLEWVLWPNRSLSPRGFVTLIAIVCVGFSIPLIPLIGTMALWGVLPFLLGTLALLWWLIRRNYADGRLCEVLTLWPDMIRVVRHNPRGPRQEWEANPFWVRLRLRAEGGPVENYLTLKGGGREIELGAFLSPEERTALHEELERALSRLGRAGT